MNLILPKWFFLIYFSSWGGNTITSSRSNASSLNVANQNNNSLDEPVSMIPCNHEQNVLQDVKSKQSQFFNSLFPSRANRFGFPVYPERSFGIPSQMNVPVSFAGFSPGMYKLEAVLKTFVKIHWAKWSQRYSKHFSLWQFYSRRPVN